MEAVEDIYRLIWTAVAGKQPISAIYKDRPRLCCPHAWVGIARQLRVLCYPYGGESESSLAPTGSPENWRCVALEKLRKVELLDGSWNTVEHRAQYSRPATCVVEADIDAEDQPEHAPQKGQ